VIPQCSYGIALGPGAYGRAEPLSSPAGLLLRIGAVISSDLRTMLLMWIGEHHQPRCGVTAFSLIIFASSWRVPPSSANPGTARTGATNPLRSSSSAGLTVVLVGFHCVFMEARAAPSFVTTPRQVGTQSLWRRLIASFLAAEAERLGRDSRRSSRRPSFCCHTVASFMRQNCGMAAARR